MTMKKFFAIAAVIAVALTGCVKNDVVNDSSNKEIAFNSYVGKATATKANTELPIDAPHFGAFALYHDGANTWAGDYTAADIFMNNAEIGYTAPIWKAVAAKYYWPKVGKLSFLAYSPYNSSASYNVGSATMTVPAAAITSGQTLTSDFLYSAATIDKTANDSQYTLGGSAQGVNIIFKHAGAKVAFKAKLAAGISTTLGTDGSGVEVKIKEITVKNVLPSASGNVTVTYDAAGAATIGAITAGGAAADQTVCNTESAALTSTASDILGNSLYVVPQAATTVTVVYSIKHGALTAYDTTGTITLTGNWESNKSYIYTMIIGFDEIQFDPEVTDWTVVESDVNVLP